MWREAPRHVDQTLTYSIALFMASISKDDFEGLFFQFAAPDAAPHGISKIAPGQRPK
jgi:hypothetical protein